MGTSQSQRGREPDVEVQSAVGNWGKRWEREAEEASETHAACSTPVLSLSLLRRTGAHLEKQQQQHGDVDELEGGGSKQHLL